MGQVCNGKDMPSVRRTALLRKVLTWQWRRSAICSKNSFASQSADLAMAKKCYLFEKQLCFAKC
jgi:hypothetical protein